MPRGFGVGIDFVAQEVVDGQRAQHHGQATQQANDEQDETTAALGAVGAGRRGCFFGWGGHIVNLFGHSL